MENVLKAPKSASEIVKLYHDQFSDNPNRIVVSIAVDAVDMVERDVEDFNDFVDSRVISYGGYLADIGYTPIEVNDRHMIILEIYAEVIHDCSDDEWDTAFERGLAE